MIAIIDYNVGNLHNLKNALDFQALPAQFVREPEALKKATHIILPGVGAFGPAMDHLRHVDMMHAAKECAGAGVPFLGVCVGMQLLFDESDEDGPHAGLGLVPGRVVRLGTGVEGFDLKVPQIGWNRVAWQREDPLVAGIPDHSYFYFVHSYHPQLAEPGDALGLTDYGSVFPAVVRRGNVMGCQFHPEKSQDAGLRLLRNFAELPAAG